ncbi:hypothetical protein [Limnohabitans sp. INBF002]|uniref:hypothetical protein n=1 Tax=Limnohabitans sp. INBF002 TaxID=2986280 RepID=UPI0023773851|nr:hypothetical protein [Limnohabitans sp. INBF002]BDU53385.1 hypothetical protein LINBF2_16200 [Limnohabitans sp. INBF002]
MKIEILGREIEISDQTKSAFAKHKGFCSAGNDVLLQVDPDCAREQALIDELSIALENDCNDYLYSAKEEMRDHIRNNIHDWIHDLAVILSND